MKKSIIGPLILLLGAWLIVQLLPESERRSEPPASVEAQGYGDIAAAFKAHQSDVQVVGQGEVFKILADDQDGRRHQKFLLRLANGQSLLIAHNIDLAPRLALQEGDTVDFQGEYEWNDRGGVVHWTHHDPSGRSEGGWLKLNGKVYR